MQQSKRRTKEQQFNDACERLEQIIESEKPQVKVPLARVAIGTAFLMYAFDPERARGILTKVYDIYQQRSTEIKYIRRTDEDDVIDATHL